MTYSVTYSFVPGTKARADEVNTNFIDILNHLENTNARIDTTNTLIESANTQIEDINTNLSECANLSLSNLNEDGKEVLNKKADANLLDGKWVCTSKTLCIEKVITPGEAQTYSLKSILPTENDLYEIIIDGQLHTDVAGGSAYVYIKTPKTTSLAAFRVVSPNRYGSIQALAVCQGNHNIIVSNQPGAVESSTYTLYIRAYRKVR